MFLYFLNSVKKEHRNEMSGEIASRFLVHDKKQFLLCN